MTQIALAFISEKELLPYGLKLTPFLNHFVICAEHENLRSEKTRLIALQNCFDSGLDILPISPRYSINLELLMDNSAIKDSYLRMALARIKGNGQVSLTIHKPTEQTGFPLDGRGWMQMRKRKKDGLAAMKQWLQKQAETTGRHLSECTETSSTVNISILAPRLYHERNMEELKNTIEANNNSFFEGMKVSISGLWPALGFCALPLTTKASNS